MWNPNLIKVLEDQIIFWMKMLELLIWGYDQTFIGIQSSIESKVQP
jgi:hypothetical protein